MAGFVSVRTLAEAWQSSSSPRTHYTSAVHCIAHSAVYLLPIRHLTQPVSGDTEPAIREALVPRTRPSRNRVPTSYTGPGADTRSYKDCWVSWGLDNYPSSRSSARYASLTTYHHSRLLAAVVPFFITSNVQQ